MNKHMRTRRLIAGGLLGSLSTVSFAFPITIDPGFDLLETVQPTNIELGPLGVQPFEGLPFGTFDFGSGSTFTGTTDTILQRVDSATGNAPGDTVMIDVEMVALQLVSVNPIAGSLGGTAGGRVLATNPFDLGSTMTITFDTMNGGTFDSALTFNFDLVDLMTGTLLQTMTIAPPLDQRGAVWSTTPMTPLVVPGVTSNFFTGLAQHFARFPEHSTRSATVPEPTSVLLLGAGLLGMAAMRARSRGRALAAAA